MVWGWLAVAGIAGVYYIAKNGEVASWLFNANGETLSQAWLAEGATLNDTSNVYKALRNVINSFNDFMDEVFTSDLIDEFKTKDPATGLMTLPDFHIRLPNGMVLKVIDGDAVGDFRIAEEEGTAWRGFTFNLGGVGALSCYIGFRLVADPNFEYEFPGSRNFYYIDPSSITLECPEGIVRLGSECDPIQCLKSTDVEYIAESCLLFTFICDMLHKLGLFKVLRAWWTKFILRRSISDIHNDVTDVATVIEDIATQVDEIKNLSNDDDFNALYEKIRKLGYRPYG